jgi:hypothetical protein
MSYECEKFEEIESPINCENPTLIQILEELNRLKLENELLKADKKEMLREIQQLKNDKMVLHNKFDENNQYTTVVDGNDDLSYIDEYAKGLDLFKDNYKIGGNDIKNQ